MDDLEKLEQLYQLPTAADYAMGAAKLVIYVGWLALLWAYFNRMTKGLDDHHEMYVAGNAAMAWRRGGLVVGQALGMTGLMAIDDVWWMDLLWMFVGGAAITLILLGFRSALKLIIGESLSASIVRAAFYSMGGWIIAAGLTGNAPSLGTGIASALTFTVLGLAVLAGVYVFNSMLPMFRVHRLVRQNNVAAGVFVAGFIVGLGIVLHNAIAGDFVGWGSAFAGFIATFVVAVGAFYVLGWMVDRWIFTHDTLRGILAKEQLIPATMLAVFQVVIAFGITSLPIW
jgi:uncharacterized membrane protein YjfL (UPF0719 family)